MDATPPAVLAWRASQLPDRVAGAAAHELEDGEELAAMSARSLQKLLKHVTTAAQSQTLLACRNAVLEEQQQMGDEGEGEREEKAPAAAAAAAVDPCEICFEPFDRGERLPRLLKECGHTFCARAPALPQHMHWRGSALILVLIVLMWVVRA